MLGILADDPHNAFAFYYFAFFTQMCIRDRLESDYEKGVVFRVFAQLKAAAAENLSLAEAVSGLLPQEKEHYLDMACLLLAKVYSPVDTEYLRRLGKGAAGPPGLK